MKMSTALVAALALFGAAAFCHAQQQQKIAVINMEKVFQGYYKTKISDANLKKQAELFKNYAEKLNESRVKLENEFKDLRDQSQNIALSDSERESKRVQAQEKFRQLSAKETELKQYDSEKKDQLKEQYDQMRGKLLDDIKRQIEKKCVVEGYTLVLDVSGKTLNNIPAVMYSSGACDITEAVLKELNTGNNLTEEKKDKDKKDSKDGKSDDKKTERKQDR